MKPTISLITVCALLFIATSYSDTDAQTRTTEGRKMMHGDPIQNTVGLGLRGGYFISPDADAGTWSLGAQTRIRIGPVFGIEGAFDYQGRQQFLTEDQERDVRHVPITGSLLVHAPLGPYFVPYGLAGAGAYLSFEEFSDLIDDPVEETNVNFGIHLGLGVEVPADKHIAFHADWRYVFLDDAIDMNDLTASGNWFTFGATFYFGQW